MPERIGIYSGTFDPLHQGHIALAQTAKERCGLDRVLFLPERIPRHKPQVTPFEERVMELKKTTQKFQDLDVMLLPDQHFTVRRTLHELRSSFPGAELTFVLGSDLIKGSFLHWPHVDELMLSAALAIGLRADDTETEVHNILQAYSKRHTRTLTYEVLRTDFPHVSSTRIRGTGSDTTG